MSPNNEILRLGEMIKFSAPRFRSPCRRGQPHAPDVQEKTSRCLFLTKPPWFITVPPFIPSESISKQPLRATQWAGTRQVTQAEGQSGRGAGTQVSPGSHAQCRRPAVGAVESPRQAPPLEPDHLTLPRHRLATRPPRPDPQRPPARVPRGQNSVSPSPRSSRHAETVLPVLGGATGFR